MIFSLPSPRILSHTHGSLGRPSFKASSQTIATAHFYYPNFETRLKPFSFTGLQQKAHRKQRSRSQTQTLLSRSCKRGVSRESLKATRRRRPRHPPLQNLPPRRRRSKSQAAAAAAAAPLPLPLSNDVRVG